MENLELELPAMYGDHHVLAVRALALGLEGVQDIWASAAYRWVEIDYDPDKTDAEKITAALREAGYTQPLANVVIPSRDAMRHTSTYVGVDDSLAFLQPAPAASRPMPCPGFQIDMRKLLEKEE